MKTILTIAGSDTSAGAGIQQDLKTITALGHYAVTVPTALTAQNTVGVQRVMAVPDNMLRAQLDSVLSDISVAAVKIGMIPNGESARVITAAVSQLRVPVVCDPVMLSTSGTQLMADECIDYIMQTLFPLCTLITPNLPEALRLSGLPAGSDAEAMGRRLVSMCGTAFLLKGGHAEGRLMRDILYCPDGERHEYCSPRIDSPNLHGTGCTLSSAVAALLAEGRSLPEAVAGAKTLIDKGIAGGRALRIGRGNGPLWLF
ncbi:MAG: bifunctional hydroxymethylpyrimidine kinase/phosphomethylpyrimidine kinase [Prevotellaceae bacterium]|nr:bifunctional hydroxymethylpyrimidine kinase/phosphomethylpyrimidine kinase [Prevotellaceae bacterium]MDY2749694.1 bifunctional hydroxymethylpyrimidine kinase/phosphomethylpyrimidine kinase [Prevotella sp.]